MGRDGTGKRATMTLRGIEAEVKKGVGQHTRETYRNLHKRHLPEKETSMKKANNLDLIYFCFLALFRNVHFFYIACALQGTRSGFHIQRASRGDQGHGRESCDKLDPREFLFYNLERPEGKRGRAYPSSQSSVIGFCRCFLETQKKKE